MELLNRYLSAVQRYLPKAQQADVIAELSDSIQSAVEEKEAELGRPLSIDEESAIINSYGHPILAASRYRSHQQLIGPALFPFYVNTLKVVLPIALGVIFVVALMFWVGTGDAMAAAARFWGAMWGTFFVIFGIVTAIFGAVERLQPNYYKAQWDPRSLPAVGAQRVPRSTSSVELVFNLLFVAWLAGVPAVRQLFDRTIMAPLLELPFRLGPWWQELVPALLVVALAHALMNCVNLIRPDCSDVRAGTFAVTHGVMLIVVCYVLRQHNFIMVSGAAGNAARYAEAANTLNWAVFIGLVCFALICAVTIVLNVRKLVFRTKALPDAHRDAEAR